MTYLIAFLQILFLLFVGLLISYVKKIPEQVHSKNLELYKSELSKEVEKLKITEGNLHLRKIEKFTEFTGILYNLLNSVKYQKGAAKIERDATKAMEAFTKDLIFFASERTLDKFVEYRRYSKLVQAGGPNEQARFQFILAELVLEMRRDLGFENDGIDVDHYMYILMNDWDAHKEDYHSRSKDAQKLNK
ncbi:hypothetical protein SLU01_19230 [Sporosarcina luteola]|uniref:Uncharacterized protein n=1 Tax=Sporosarcina luteola TaxID=582850 RepID=A0A511Z836_9BACL|nr:hypothetical protein [Sporosarcina luteola]GEN83611.1 hypothetical protein SLU01_19230 [Sporosarcina luteola]